MNTLFTPSFLLTQSSLFLKLKTLAETQPNDLDLGKSVRKLFNDYNDGKFNPPLDIEFDTPIIYPH